MKYGVLTTILLLLMAAAAGAQEIGGAFDPHDMRIVVPYRNQQTVPVRQQHLTPLNRDAKCVRLLKNITSCEYALIPSSCILQLGLDPERAGVTTRLKLFNREIYLTFSIVD